MIKQLIHGMRMNMKSLFWYECQECGKHIYTIEAAVIHLMWHHRDGAAKEIMGSLRYIMSRLAIVQVFRIIFRTVCQICYWATLPIVELNDIFDWLRW